MKNYKSLIMALSITTIVNVSYANQTVCNSTWDITAKGIKIGVTNEKFTSSDTTFEITSHFKPYAAVSLFGVPELKRTAISNKDLQLNYRKEIMNPESENKITEWNMIGATKWQKIVNDEKEAPVDIALTVIDSTMFPYLLILNKILPTNENKFIAMGKGDPYPITFTLGKNENGFQMNSNVDSGYMVFNKEHEPIKFGATQKGTKIEGKRVSWSCDENK